MGQPERGRSCRRLLLLIAILLGAIRVLSFTSDAGFISVASRSVPGQITTCGSPHCELDGGCANPSKTASDCCSGSGAISRAMRIACVVVICIAVALGGPAGSNARAAESTLGEVEPVATYSTVALSKPVLAEELTKLPENTAIIVQGLQRLPEFNGLSGTVQSFDDATQRYNISCITRDGIKLAKVKRENLLRKEIPLAPSMVPKQAGTLVEELDRDLLIGGGFATALFGTTFALRAAQAGADQAIDEVKSGVSIVQKDIIAAPRLVKEVATAEKPLKELQKKLGLMPPPPPPKPKPADPSGLYVAALLAVLALSPNVPSNSLGSPPIPAPSIVERRISDPDAPQRKAEGSSSTPAPIIVEKRIPEQGAPQRQAEGSSPTPAPIIVERRMPEPGAPQRQAEGSPSIPAPIIVDRRIPEQGAPQQQAEGSPAPPALTIVEKRLPEPEKPQPQAPAESKTTVVKSQFAAAQSDGNSNRLPSFVQGSELLLGGIVLGGALLLYSQQGDRTSTVDGVDSVARDIVAAVDGVDNVARDVVVQEGAVSRKADNGAAVDGVDSVARDIVAQEGAVYRKADNGAAIDGVDSVARDTVAQEGAVSRKADNGAVFSGGTTLESFEMQDSAPEDSVKRQTADAASSSRDTTEATLDEPSLPRGTPAPALQDACENQDSAPEGSVQRQAADVASSFGDTLDEPSLARGTPAPALQDDCENQDIVDSAAESLEATRYETSPLSGSTSSDGSVENGGDTAEDASIVLELGRNPPSAASYASAETATPQAINALDVLRGEAPNAAVRETISEMNSSTASVADESIVSSSSPAAALIEKREAIAPRVASQIPASASPITQAIDTVDEDTSAVRGLLLEEPDVRLSEEPDVEEPDVRLSEEPGVRLSKEPGVQEPDVGLSEEPDVVVESFEDVEAASCVDNVSLESTSVDDKPADGIRGLWRRLRRRERAVKGLLERAVKLRGREQ